jgi:hypothetical protein
MSRTTWVLTPDTSGTVGGVKMHYQLVDALNAAGRSAAVVHGEPGFRCTWFANRTHVVAAAEVELCRDDLIVVPEEWVQHIPALPAQVTKVIFNQNAYTTFLWGVASRSICDIYARPDVACVIGVSDDNLDYFRYAFPSTRAVGITCLLDPSLFHDRDAKTRSIAYMPRKRRQESDEVLALLHARGALVGWTVRPISGLSEDETARVLRECSVFLAFGHREGFGLPAAEAMACGCIVVGFHGFGGRDIGDTALWIPDGDVVAYAQTVEAVLRSWDAERAQWAERGRAGAEHIRVAFSPAAFEARVICAFDEIPSTNGDAEPLGSLPMACWKGPPRWPGVMNHLRAAARVALKGGT